MVWVDLKDGNRMPRRTIRKTGRERSTGRDQLIRSGAPESEEKHKQMKLYVVRGRTWIAVMMLLAMAIASLFVTRGGDHIMWHRGWRSLIIFVIFIGLSAAFNEIRSNRRRILALSSMGAVCGFMASALWLVSVERTAAIVVAAAMFAASSRRWFALL